MKPLEVRQKYSAAHRIFQLSFSVSPGDETLCLMLDILHIERGVLVHASACVRGKFEEHERAVRVAPRATLTS